MAQQVFDKSWPLGKNGASELIPGGAILQTRDGKDEPITLSASFQLGEGGLFLPTDKDNPLETRVRELERLIGEIAATPTPNTLQARLKEIADRLGEAVASPNEHTLLARLKAVEEELEAVKDALTSGDAKVTLTGRTSEEILDRAVRSSNTTLTITVPASARGVLLIAHIHGVTGTFDTGQGLRLRTIVRGIASIGSNTSNLYEMSTDRVTQSGNVSLLIAPFPLSMDSLDPHTVNRSAKQASFPLGENLYVDLGISGSFDEGEGFDCRVNALWLF